MRVVALGSAFMLTRPTYASSYEHGRLPPRSRSSGNHMRRLSRRRARWLERYARAGCARNSCNKARRKLYIHKKIGLVAESDARPRVSLYSEGRITDAILTGEKKSVPKTLSFRADSWDDTVEFLESVGIGLNRLPIQTRSLRRTQKRSTLELPSYWDFSTIEKIDPSVALILASEYDRARTVKGWVPRAVEIDKWNPSVLRMLSDIGFLTLAGVEVPGDDVLPMPGGRFLKLRRGKSADGRAVADHISALGVDLTHEDPRLNDAIMEAITNTVHHAYRDSELCEPFRLKAWWIAASLIDLGERRNLQIAVYDQGASIPRTLPMWQKYPLLERKLRQASSMLPGVSREPNPIDTTYDGRAIELAIEIGRTSTAESNRGKGLNQIAQALDLARGGSVTIFSRCGVWRRVWGGVESSETRKKPLRGTLVLWNLDLEPQQ